MPRLTSISVTNYRAFAEEVRLELRPLTLLYGLNNVGKSTLVRLPAIIADSTLESAEGPLNLYGEAGRGASFRALLYDTERRTFDLKLTWDDGLHAHYRMRLGDDELGAIVMLVVQGHDGSKHAWVAPQEATPDLPLGAVRDGGQQFIGLLPQGPEPLWTRLRDNLRGLRGQTRWLGALRQRPQPYTERRLRPLKGDGEGALETLLLRPELLQEVDNWLQAAMNRTLRAQEVQGGRSRWLLPPLDDALRDLDLQDAGEGVLQVIPVLTALALRRDRKPHQHPILALEEPTTHLHDDLQIQLTKRFCAAAMEQDPITLVIETHSRPVLLAVQVALASGDLTPDKVILYWVEQGSAGSSRVTPVTFSKQGRPESDLLMHIFTDQPELTRQLARRWMERRAP